MIKIVTFATVSLGNEKGQSNQQQIFSANVENSHGETGTSKSIAE